MVSKQPTVVEEGEKIYSCALCKVTRIDRIPRKKLPSKGEVLLEDKTNGKYIVTKAGIQGGTVEYKECMSQPANCILRLLDKNWKSYFQAIKQYSKYPNFNDGHN